MFRKVLSGVSLMGNQFMVVEGIFKTFGRTVALNNVGFTVKEKELVCLLGPSGCGKTTLLRIIAGLEQPNAGSVLVKGADITALPPGQRSFGMVFQSYALFPNITVFHNIAYGLQNKKLGKSEIEQRIYDALRLVGLENIKDRYPAQLSGGQQQRVALARRWFCRRGFCFLTNLCRLLMPRCVPNCVMI